MDTAAPSFASWVSRVAAIVIDGLITSVVAAVFMVPGGIGMLRTAEWMTDLDGTRHLSAVEPVWIAVVALGGVFAFLFFVWNQIYRPSVSGASIGKASMGIQIVRAADGSFMSVWLSAARYVLYSMLGSACALNYIWPLFDVRNRAWHDMIVDTVVVKTPATAP